MWLALLASALLAVAPGPLETCQQKTTRIESGQLAPGTVVVFSAAELAALARYEAADFGKGSIDHVELSLWAGHAMVSARVDLPRLARARGNPMHPLLARMLSGQRQISAVLRLDTVRGHALVDLEKLEVDGNLLEGRPLDLLIQQFVNTEFPDAHLDQWFPMEYRISTIVLSGGRAVVTIGSDVHARTR
jgi:hypothetical protein